MMHHLSIDIETFSSVPIGKTGLYKYVQSPDFEVMLFAYSLDSGPVAIVDLAQGEKLPDWLNNAMFDPEYIKHAYNATFEMYCLSKFFGKPLPVDQWRDTMLHGLYCGYPAGLEAVGRALGLPQEKQKMTIGKALIKYFCTPCEPTTKNGRRTRNYPRHDFNKWSLFKKYCQQDVTTEMEVERRLSKFPVPEDIEKQWQTDAIINARGVAVDMNLVQGAIYIDKHNKAQQMDEAKDITDLANPNSVQQLSAWLKKQTGEAIADLRKDTVAAMLESDDIDGNAARMLKIRQELSRSSVKKYAAIETAVCNDGRVRGLLQFYGASRSGRWSGRHIQIHNLYRSSFSQEQLSLARKIVSDKQIDKLQLLFSSIPETLAQLIRTAFIASSGNILVDADFSAIEARVIAWLAGEQWRLEVFRTHGKIYEASASQMFGVPIEKIKKGKPEYSLRQKGKIAELALGYQGGVGALTQMGALKMGLSEGELPDIVSRWRESNKQIVNLWYSVENAAINTIKTGRQNSIRGLIFTRETDYSNNLDFLTITLPSQRKLYYAYPSLEAGNYSKPSICYYGQNQMTKQWTQLETYGGKLVENCLTGDTLVLTDSGWTRLDCVTASQKVWDGKQWVNHDGLICKGIQEVISVDGIGMTPYHKVWTGKNWSAAYCCWQFKRPITLVPNKFKVKPNTKHLAFPKYRVREVWKKADVFDLKNTGPKHCFTVLSDCGPMIVHNCVQAISRDCLATAIERLESAGFPIVFHVHDEVVIECPPEKANLDEVVRLMTEPIPWAKDLPLNADGWTGEFYKKE